MFEEALRLIEAHETIIIHRHQKPDGDALGSQAGLKLLLVENYPDKHIFCVGDTSARFGFIAPDGMDDVPDELFADALAIVLDTSASSLISDARYANAKASLRIDHHLFCEKICDVEVVDSSFESCAGLIAALSMEAGWWLTPAAATAIYTGMVTDSGRFRYDGTTSQTFRLAAYLMEAGIDTGTIYQKLYSDTLENIKLKASFIDRIETTEHGVAYIYTPHETVVALDMETAAVSRGMVGTMSDLAGLPIWVNFTENETGQIECELRSSIYNINPIAVKYGGGGHMKASGARVPDLATAMLMLKDLDQMCAEGAK